MFGSGKIVNCGLAILLALVLPAAASELGARGSAAQVQPAQQPKAVESNPLTLALGAAFSARNPAVTRAKVLELRSVGMGAGPYVLLGWGIRSDMRFQGRFDDELFGVFVVNADLTRIERTLDVFPTRRWADYIVSIEKLTDTEVTVIGQGSYGDQQLRHVYSLSASK